MSIAAPRPGGRLRRLLQVTGVFLAVVILVWLVLSIVWGGQRLGPQRDFVQEFNATIETIPMTQRAWPRLRTAVDELDLDQNRSFATQVDELVQSSDLQAQERWLRQNQEALASLRSAARLPELGLPWRGAMLPEAPDQFLLLSANERAALALVGPAEASSVDEENNPLITLPLRFLRPMRAMARLLQADARSAVGLGDLSRAVDDCTAMLDIARLCQQDPMLISQLTGLSIRALAEDTILELVSTEPLGSTPPLLEELAKALSVPIAPVSLDGERMIVQDIVQRFYSDDGAGDGVFLVSGFNEASALTNTNLPRLFYTGLLVLPDPVLQPFVARAAGTRMQVSDTLDGLISEAQNLMETDPWAINWTVLDTRQEALNSDGILKNIHLFPLPLVTPGFDPPILASHRDRFMHKVARLVIALHQFRARYGDWPQQLKQLQPDLLTELPRDPYGGAVLRYEVRDHQPVLWSIGLDGVDQGGFFPEEVTPFTLRRVPQGASSPRPAPKDARLWPMPTLSSP